MHPSKVKAPRSLEDRLDQANHERRDLPIQGTSSVRWNLGPKREIPNKGETAVSDAVLEAQAGTRRPFLGVLRRKVGVVRSEVQPDTGTRRSGSSRQGLQPRGGRSSTRGLIGQVGSALGLVEDEVDRDRLQQLSISRIQRGVSGLLSPLDPRPSADTLEGVLANLGSLTSSPPPSPTDPSSLALAIGASSTLRRGSSLGDLRGQRPAYRWISPCPSEVYGYDITMTASTRTSYHEVKIGDKPILKRSQSEPLLGDPDSQRSVVMSKQSTVSAGGGQARMLTGDEALENYKQFVKVEEELTTGELSVEKIKTKYNLEHKKKLINDTLDMARDYYRGQFANISPEWKDTFYKDNEERLTCGGRRQDIPSFIKVQLEHLVEYKPYCTFVYIMIQALALLMMCSIHGAGEVSFLHVRQMESGMPTLLGRETVDSWTTPNPWVGPSAAALIRSGAVFAPCLRRSITMVTPPTNTSLTDFRLGCCKMEMNDVSATMSLTECLGITNGLGVWTADLPCSWRPRGTVNGSQVARPCCVGLLGRCVLVTEHHCQFLRGIFHAHGPEHCSQLDCISRLCGIPAPSIPSRDEVLSSNDTTPGVASQELTPPSQHWRLLVAGVLPPGVLVFIPQGVLLKVLGSRVEAGAGAPRMALILFVSSVGGLTTGALFTPDRPHSGSQAAVGGLLGVVTVEILHNAPIVMAPWRQAAKLLLLFGSLLTVGTLPYVDNYELLGGYLLGVLCAVSVLPYICFGRWSAVRRQLLLAVAVPGTTLLIALMLYGLYEVQTLTSVCPGCPDFTCVPFVNNMCEVMEDVEH